MIVSQSPLPLRQRNLKRRRIGGRRGDSRWNNGERERREMSNPSSAPGSGPSAAAGRKRGPTPCCTKLDLKRGPWTPVEDEVLASFVRREGVGRWGTLPKRAGLLRCGKSCRLRWMNYLRPSIKHGHIAPDEEDLILRLHRLLGNRWSLIAGRIPGRTDNEIKNYWNTHLSKKLVSQGIDPRTHKPLNPNTPSPLPNYQFKVPAPVTASLPYPTLNPSPNSNPNAAPKPVSSALEETEAVPGSSYEHQRNYSAWLDVVHDEAWQGSEASALMGLQGSHGGNGNEDEGVDCCTDDVFSSFLDSLINEDMFLEPQQQQNMSNSDNNIDQSEPIDPTMSSASGFGP